MTEEKPQPATPVDRLCSEIQLFDLCDLAKCGHKNARFCTNELLLRKFEAIKEEDDRQTLLYDEDELEDEDEFDVDVDEIDEEFEEEYQ